MDSLRPLTLPSPASAAGDESVERQYSRRTLLLAAAIPLLFLHVMYQPKASFGLGGTSVDVALSDLAIASVAAAAFLVFRREGGGAP